MKKPGETGGSEGPNGKEGLTTVTFDTARHQKPGRPGRTEPKAGEACPRAGRDEAVAACHGDADPGQGLLRQVFARENLVLAWKRVKANKGSAGVDGLSIEQTAEYLRTAWPRIREELLSGRYRPSPVRRVQIPKPGCQWPIKLTHPGRQKISSRVCASVDSSHLPA